MDLPIALGNIAGEVGGGNKVLGDFLLVALEFFFAGGQFLFEVAHRFIAAIDLS